MTATDLIALLPPGTRVYARIVRRSRTGAHADLMVFRIRTADPSAEVVRIERHIAHAIGAVVDLDTGDLRMPMSGAGPLTDLARRIPQAIVTEV